LWKRGVGSHSWAIEHLNVILNLCRVLKALLERCAVFPYREVPGVQPLQRPDNLPVAVGTILHSGDHRTAGGTYGITNEGAAWTATDETNEYMSVVVA
jgi:hypothetical protein